MMKEMPRAGFVCTGENALELSGAICCGGRLMRYFNENGFTTGGCYSCIAPSKQLQVLKERIVNLCACNDVVVTIGCEGFRECDVLPDLLCEISHRTVTPFVNALCGNEYVDATTKRTVKCFPSRATAIMYESCLVLNLPSDVATAVGRLSALMNSVGFIVSSTGEKRPFQTSNLGELTANYYCKSSFQD